MKIIWNQNPFHTTVELDDYDKEMFLISYQKDRYEDFLCDMQNKHENDIPINFNKWEYICNLTINSNEIIETLNYLNSMHSGDCVCFSCSCMRCHIEYLLNINTIKGLGPHEANKILVTFGEKGQNSIDEAIKILNITPDYNKPDTWPKNMNFDVHIPRWERERNKALFWLKNYKEEHKF